MRGFTDWEHVTVDNVTQVPLSDFALLDKDEAALIHDDVLSVFTRDMFSVIPAEAYSGWREAQVAQFSVDGCSGIEKGMF